MDELNLNPSVDPQGGGSKKKIYIAVGVLAAVAIVVGAVFITPSEGTQGFIRSRGRDTRTTQSRPAAADSGPAITLPPTEASPFNPTVSKKVDPATYLSQGLRWDKVDNSSTNWKTLQNSSTGETFFTYKIRLDYSLLPKKLQTSGVQTGGGVFSFKTLYKPHWGAGAWSIKESSPYYFNTTVGGMPILANPNGSNAYTSSASSTNKNNAYTGIDGSIYVQVPVHWPGLGIASDPGFADWGKTDVDIVFYDAQGQKINITSKYIVEQVPAPKLYVNVSESGCLGWSDWDFQIGNSGGVLPTVAYNRVKLYVSGDGYGPKGIEDAFGDATPIIQGNGAKSDWECHDSGNGNVWLVRDTIQGSTTIWHEKK